MKNFIKGMLFIAVVLPLLENILSICAQSVEFICTKIATKTYALKKLLGEEPSEETHVIGFSAPITAEEEYEEEE